MPAMQLNGFAFVRTAFCFVLLICVSGKADDQLVQYEPPPLQVIDETPLAIGPLMELAPLPPLCVETCFNVFRPLCACPTVTTVTCWEMSTWIEAYPACVDPYILDAFSVEHESTLAAFDLGPMCIDVCCPLCPCHCRFRRR